MMTTKERVEVNWHLGSAMTGQALYSKVHWKHGEAPPVFTRAINSRTFIEQGGSDNVLPQFDRERIRTISVSSWLIQE